MLKGVILAGGKGTRLDPLTRAVNKHLLPVGGKPMLQHCVEKMVEANITDILIVTGGEHLGGIAEFLGSGERFDCRFTFKVQDEAGGIAQALSLAKGFVGPCGRMCVLLGDNMFEDSLRPLMMKYLDKADPTRPGAMVVVKKVPDPERFGVASIVDDNIVLIEEKPDVPASDFAVTGIYFYDGYVFQIIDGLNPSERGELEITDVNNAYIEQEGLYYAEMHGWWTDAGTHESYEKANELMRGE